MKYAKIGASLVSFPLLSAFGATYYYFPELRHNKSQLLKAFTRMLRVGARGAQMAGIYLIVYIINLHIFFSISIIYIYIHLTDEFSHKLFVYIIYNYIVYLVDLFIKSMIFFF